MGCQYGNKGVSQSGRNTECGKGPHGKKGGKSLVGQVMKSLDHTSGLCVNVWIVQKVHEVTQAVLDSNCSS